MESCVRLRAQSGVGLRESLPPSFCSWPSYSCAHAHFQAQKNSAEITGFLGGWSSWWIRERVEWAACEDMVLLQQALMCIHARWWRSFISDNCILWSVRFHTLFHYNGYDKNLFQVCLQTTFQRRQGWTNANYKKWKSLFIIPYMVYSTIP